VVVCHVSEGVVKYSVSMVDTQADRLTVPLRLHVSVLDVNGSVVSTSATSAGTLVIRDVQLWWPYTFNSHRPAYLYTLQVSLPTSTHY